MIEIGIGSFVSSIPDAGTGLKMSATGQDGNVVGRSGIRRWRLFGTLDLISKGRAEIVAGRGRFLRCRSRRGGYDRRGE